MVYKPKCLSKFCATLLLSFPEAYIVYWRFYSFNSIENKLKFEHMHMGSDTMKYVSIMFLATIVFASFMATRTAATSSMDLSTAILVQLINLAKEILRRYRMSLILCRLITRKLFSSELSQEHTGTFICKLGISSCLNLTVYGNFIACASAEKRLLFPLISLSLR